MRFPQIAVFSIFATLVAYPLLAQSTNGTINGLVLDPSNKVIAGADVLVINNATGVTYSSKTNGDGIYVAPNLPPGPYRIQVAKVGFKTLVKPDIVLNIQDALSINFTLPVGAVFETVTVEGGAPLVNTESASVSTVVDRKYVENMPLNGRKLPGSDSAHSGRCYHNSPSRCGHWQQRRVQCEWPAHGVELLYGRWCERQRRNQCRLRRRGRNQWFLACAHSPRHNTGPSLSGRSRRISRPEFYLLCRIRAQPRWTVFLLDPFRN